MLFNSLTFLIFFPAITIVYFLLPHLTINPNIESNYGWEQKPNHILLNSTTLVESAVKIKNDYTGITYLCKEKNGNVPLDEKLTTDVIYKRKRHPLLKEAFDKQKREDSESAFRELRNIPINQAHYSTFVSLVEKYGQKTIKVIVNITPYQSASQYKNLLPMFWRLQKAHNVIELADIIKYPDFYQKAYMFDDAH